LAYLFFSVRLKHCRR